MATVMQGRRQRRRSRRARRGRPLWQRSGLWWTLALVGLASGTTLLLTNDRPWLDQPPTPTAEQVRAANQAITELRRATDAPNRTIEVKLSGPQLAALGVLTSDVMRPDRLLIETDGARINIVHSHLLWFGRWLNLGLVSGGRAGGFPEVNVSVGHVSLPPQLGRYALEAVRYWITLRGTELAPLDQLMPRSRIVNGQVTALIQLPPQSAILNQLSDRKPRAESVDVLAAYCRLTRLHDRQPITALTEALGRAFTSMPVQFATPQTNRTAFVALAMYTVSPQVGSLVGLSTADIKPCRAGPFDLTLQGRADLTKHWAMSAALAVTNGPALTEAVGEWKELADSASGRSEFAQGDPTGFSFVDLAADRSGVLAAKDALAEGNAARWAEAMTGVSEDELLPPALMKLEDGMKQEAFVKAYGSIRDPRYLARVREIEAALGPQPLFSRGGAGR